MANLPQDITIAQLNQKLSIARSEYTKAHNRAKKLDMLDRNKLWDAIKAKFPKYQLLPQTNDVSYIKNNILASIYTVGKSAQLEFTSAEDKDVVTNLNIALEHIWGTRNIAFYQLQAGERAALLNLGVTQVGWDNSIITGKDATFEKGQVVLKNIDPLKYYRDPSATDLDTAEYVVTWDDYHESVILNNPKYKDEFSKYLNAKKTGSTVVDGVTISSDKISPSSANKPGYYRVYVWFVRTKTGINEIHMVDNVYPIAVKEKIQPDMFPFAELYCNLPAGDLIGTSEPAKIADNSIVRNLMLSMSMTAEYKNQRPPRFVNGQSGINIKTFTQHGNDADRTFVVNGDASRAVQYHQFPVPSPQAMSGMQMLSSDMERITGVNGKYTGGDTGSVLTTGGINSMLDQATLIDTTKVNLYENYCKRLSQLVIFNYINNSATDRSYLRRTGTNEYKMVEVPFTKIDASIVFDYNINISSEMPKNKQRIAATADAMMEKQMQYAGAGVDVDLITPQEYLLMQDIPYKEYFQERMGIQRTQNWNKIVSQAVAQYSALIDNGMTPADAITSTASTLEQQSTPEGADMGNIAQNLQLF